MSEDIFSIFLVEDNRLIAFQLSQELTSAGYQITTASSGDEAIRLANTCSPDLILMDVNLDGERDGVEIMKIIHEKNGFIPNIYLTGYTGDELTSSAAKTAPTAILEKPVNSTALMELIESLKPGKLN
jgi:CheY-like chemotaxis protein